MTLQNQIASRPASPDSSDQLAENLVGFSDSAPAETPASASTTIFVSAPSGFSNGRCGYLLDANEQRVYVGNRCQCWFIEATIVTQESDQFGSSEKLLITVQTEDGASYTFRTGLNSWTSSSLLACFRRMSRDQIAEKIEITLTPRSRTVFASVATLQPDGTSFKRVELSQDELGTKLSYDEMLDCLSYMNGVESISTLDQLRQSSTADDADRFMEVEPTPTTAEDELDAIITAAKADHAPVPQAQVAAKFTAKRKQPRRTAAKAKAAG